MTRPNLNAVAMITDELAGSIGSTGFHVLRANSVSPGWIYYRVQSEDFISAMSMKVQGALYPAVRPKDIGGFELNLPPLNEQGRVVGEIEKQVSRLDAATDALKRVQANLKRYRASVLKAACEGRLVPTEAEVARKVRREYEPADQLLERILRERRARWEADTLARMIASGKPPKDDGWKQKYKQPAAPDTKGLPDIPSGWTVASLEQLTSESRPICYGILMPKENVREGVLFVKVKDMKGDRIDLQSLHRTTKEIASAFHRASLRTGDVLLAIRGTYGRVAEVPAELDGGNITQDTVRLDVSPFVSRKFLMTSLRSPDCQNYFKRVARGVAVKGVNVGDVRTCPILLPPSAEQDVIAPAVDRQLSLIDRLEVEVTTGLRKGTNLRTATLRSAFSGVLVAQDPTDEPASFLLERIRAERGAAVLKNLVRRRKQEFTHA
jgi:type I restriction enzyme S subunit